MPVPWSKTISLAAVCCALSIGCDRCETSAGPDADDRVGDSSPRPRLGSQPATEDWEEVDPYCGMKLRRSEAAATLVHRGRTYYFCLTDHRDAFSRDPDRYLGARSVDEGQDAGSEAGARADAGQRSDR